MSNSYGPTADNLMLSLPAVLQEDERMVAIAQATADVLSSRPDEIESVLIYPNIDSLPEELLDILADDFKVDWYGYNYSLQAKRNLIKTQAKIHRVLGTKAAVEDAVSAVYTDSIVEEWFEYDDGEPYHFRVIINQDSPVEEVTAEELEKAIDIYKSFRSHLDSISYRSHSNILVTAEAGYIVYSVRRCGTYPVRTTQGSIEDSPINSSADGAGIAYSLPLCGTAQGGIL